jgi:hypothetical protein
VSCWFKPEKEICSQSDLSDKALYLWSYEYWSLLIHTMKYLGISVSARTECPMLYNKNMSIKLANYRSPSCHLPLQLINCPLNKGRWSWVIWTEPTVPFSASFCLHFPFSFKKNFAPALQSVSLFNSLFLRHKDPGYSKTTPW